MKSACEKWREPLLEAALSGKMRAELADHVRTCPHCAAEWKVLEARAGRLAELLPMVVQGTEPSPEFRAKVIAAAGTTTVQTARRSWRMLVLAGAVAAALVVLVVGNFAKRNASRGLSPEELATAQKLVEWQAPSDALLATPGQEMLRTVPKFGQSFLHVPKKNNREE
jgi:hypothetical protein